LGQAKSETSQVEKVIARIEGEIRDLGGIQAIEQGDLDSLSKSYEEKLQNTFRDLAYKRKERDQLSRIEAQIYRKVVLLCLSKLQSESLQGVVLFLILIYAELDL
jgi:hypothetical protein